MSKTPARVAAQEAMARHRKMAYSVLVMALEAVSRIDHSGAVPLETSAERDLALAENGLEALLKVLPKPTPGSLALNGEDPRWAELHYQIRTVGRYAQWIRSEEPNIYDALVAGNWSREREEDLAGALNRLERLAVAFGYPMLPPRQAWDDPRS